MSEILQTQQSVKLYEYEYNNLTLDDVLEHHGIKGQKHGVRNGPPYPLDSSISTGKRLKKKAKKKIKWKPRKNKKKASSEPRYKDKKEAMDAKDIEYIAKNKGMFTTNELNEVMNRINAEQRIDQMVYNKKQAKKIYNSKAFRIIAGTAISGLSFAAVNYAMAGASGRSNYSAKKFATDLAIGATIGLITNATPDPYSKSVQDVKRLKGLSVKKQGG